MLGNIAVIQLVGLSDHLYLPKTQVKSKRTNSLALSEHEWDTSLAQFFLTVLIFQFLITHFYSLCAEKCAEQAWDTWYNYRQSLAIGLKVVSISYLMLHSFLFYYTDTHFWGCGAVLQTGPLKWAAVVVKLSPESTVEHRLQNRVWRAVDCRAGRCWMEDGRGRHHTVKLLPVQVQ